MRLSESILNSLKENKEQPMAAAQVVEYMREKLNSKGATIKEKDENNIIISYLGRDLILSFNFEDPSNYFIKLEKPGSKRCYSIKMGYNYEDNVKECLNSIIEKVTDFILPSYPDLEHHYFDSEIEHIKWEYNAYTEDLIKKLKNTTDKKEIKNLEKLWFTFKDYVKAKYPEVYEKYKKKL